MASRRERHVQGQANSANALLQDSTLANAWAECERAVIEQLIHLDVQDLSTEHQLVLQLRANRMHRQMVERFLASGDVEAFNALQREREVG